MSICNKTYRKLETSRNFSDLLFVLLFLNTTASLYYSQPLLHPSKQLIQFEHKKRLKHPILSRKYKSNMLLSFRNLLNLSLVIALQNRVTHQMM